MKIRLQSVSAVAILICGFCGIVFGQTPRRDDQWPPKSVLALFKNVARTCAEQTGVTQEAIKEFSDGEIHEDQALKCYMNCLFHEVNVVDDNGDVHLETLFNTIPRSLREVLFKMATKCTTPVGDTLCEKAWWFHQCWKKADPVHYFLI